MTTISVSVPTTTLRDDTRRMLGAGLDVDFVVWDGSGPPPREQVDIVVPLNYRIPETVPNLSKIGHRLVQSQSIGFEGVAARLSPGTVWANASSVHDTATAEQALALLLAAQRGIPGVVDRQRRGSWERELTVGLADRRVVLLGYGGVGKAIAARLAGFEVGLVPVASRDRVEDGIRVHGIDRLPDLLGDADVLVAALPGGERTRGLVDDRVLSLLPDGALLVNVGRGSTVVTEALVDHVKRGRLRVASDVFDPEPLPPDHPLWDLDGVLVAPHMGGMSRARFPRMARLLAEQIRRMATGAEPLNVVIRT